MLIDSLIELRNCRR